MDTETEKKVPITILDYVKSKVGEKETYSYGDHIDNGVPMLGGCYGCAASLATYNMYPGRNGYIHCADCIGENGYATVEEFSASLDESLENAAQAEDYDESDYYDADED